MISASPRPNGTGEKKYVSLASRAADFVLTRMRQPDGKLYRTSLAEGPAKLNAYLEDYAYMIEGLLQLVEATWEQRWLDSAIELADIMIAQFLGSGTRRLLLRRPRS